MLMFAIDVCVIRAETVSCWRNLTHTFPPVVIAYRVSLIVADCFLILTTWFSVAGPQHVQMRKNTFATVLPRNGEKVVSAV